MDPRQFRNTLGHFATGVTVITTKNEEELIGLTANAFSSLSLDPPLILVCIDKKAGSLSAFKQGHSFVVNILQEGQEEECWRFAKRSEDKFANSSYTLSSHGIPVLNDNLATLECTVAELLEGGDHIIVTGKVEAVSYDEEKSPLLFFRGKIGQMKKEEQVIK
ncbi:flavin reductase family protein [Neobacillus drentensis]|uniref:flavin reductase family protein n=1 Tax=Neobacillus drentensis TaxID=220684 RepID=UPI001F2211FD|nr:flavin reductase family protein [Neobacillus drentensis]ULT58018.1 flavin reductase family protein [Neobacillus drentensis]